MVGAVKLHSLGVPVITDEFGHPIAVKTRKALAILTFLLRAPGETIPREVLADVFWSESPREKATQSLRQALMQLRKLEDLAGAAFLETDNMHVSVKGEVFDWDLLKLESLIKRGGVEDFEDATGLWKGEFLAGFETLDREFNNWLLIERERLRTNLISVAFDKIGSMSNTKDNERIAAAAKFLLHLDKALEPAHQIMIQVYLQRGQRQRALQQLKTCERELRVSLDAEPEPATYRLFEEEIGSYPFAIPVAMEQIRGAAVDTAGGEEIRLPEISIFSLSLNQSGDAKAKRLRDEIVSGLSSYRSFELVQAEYQGDETEATVTRIDGGDLGSFLLRFRHDAPTSRVYIQFEDRDTGRILFNEIVDFQLRSGSDEAEVAALQTISRIRSHIFGHLRRPGATAPFAKWCQAEALIWEFTPAADKKALQILNELERTHSTFAMTFAGQASINMKRLLYYPNETVLPGLGPLDILAIAERSILLDPWQPFNQRVYGWALVQAGLGEDAQRAFRQAEHLNPIDPNNLMSVAEGLAFVGDVEHARKVADRALSLFPAVPRILYEYMANVHFAAEDYTAAAEFIERAPVGSIFGLTTRVAALVCTGREEEALTVLRTIGNRFASVMDRQLLERADRPSWWQRINFFQNPTTRANYHRGADLVHRYISGSL